MNFIIAFVEDIVSMLKSDVPFTNENVTLSFGVAISVTLKNFERVGSEKNHAPVSCLFSKANTHSIFHGHAFSA